MSTFDPAADLAAVADGLEAIAFVRRSGATVPISHALRRAAISAEHEPSGGCVAQCDVVWHLPAAALDAPPELGERIVDANGAAWTILEATLATLGSRWQCRARNLVIAGGLQARISIEIGSFTKGEHGAAAVSWSTWRANVPARIQPLEVRPEVRDDARLATATHTIYLADDLELDARHRVRDATGNIYFIERAERAERIGDLPRLIVRRG